MDDVITEHEAEISVKTCNGWSLKGKTRFGGAVVGRERPRPVHRHDDAITDGQLLSARHTILSCNPGFVPSQSVRWRCKLTGTHATTSSTAVAIPDQQLCHYFSSHESCAEYELSSTVLASIPDAYITAITANAAGDIFFADANSKSVFRGTYRDRTTKDDHGEEPAQDLVAKDSVEFTTSVIISGTTNVWGLTISLQGHLYIADALSNTIGRIGCAYPTDVRDTVCLEYESWVRPMIVGNRMPSDVAVSAFGDVFVADALNNYVCFKSLASVISRFLFSSCNYIFLPIVKLMQVWSYCLNDNDFHEIVPSDGGILNWPRYITRSRDGSTTYLSDLDNNRIVAISYNKSMSSVGRCGSRVVSVDTLLADVEPSRLQLTADDHLAMIDLSKHRLLYIDLSRPHAPPVQGPIVYAATATFSLAPFGHLYYADSEQQLHRISCLVTNNDKTRLGYAVGVNISHSHASLQAPLHNASRIENANFDFDRVRAEPVSLFLRAAIVAIAALVTAVLFAVVQRWYDVGPRYRSLSSTGGRLRSRSEQRRRSWRRRTEESEDEFGLEQQFGDEEEDSDRDDDETSNRLQQIFGDGTGDELQCDSYYDPH